MNGGDEGSTLDFVKCGRGGDDGSACDAFTESDGSDQPPVLTALVSNAHTGSYKQICYRTYLLYWQETQESPIYILKSGMSVCKVHLSKTCGTQAFVQ